VTQLTPGSVQPTAALNRRFIAGAIDALILGLLCLVLFLFPLVTRGLVLPMWGVLAAVVGYAVVPLSAFRATLGMKLLGLELVTKDGHGVSPGDVLFRELIGRGYFPLAYILTLMLAGVATLLHLMNFVAPTGMTFFFAVVCMFALIGSGLGTLLAANRADRRSLADLIARSYVRPAQARPPGEDEDERQLQRRESSARIRNVVIAELVLFGGALALPWVLTQRTESREQYANRLKRDHFEAQLKANPDDEGVVTELLRLNREAGEVERTKELSDRLDALQVKKAKEREESLKRRIEQDPSDQEAMGTLLDLLDESGRAEEAVHVYSDFVDRNDDAELRAGYTRWLMNHGFNQGAMTELERAAKQDPKMEGVHALRGELFHRAGELEKAQEELYLAVLEDPDDDDAQHWLEVLDVPALTPAKKKQLEKKFAAETKERSK
jgi:uncharacterized RDD family membrane protein YckC/thioredoxin-like negative regulator of GroEL